MLEKGYRYRLARITLRAADVKQILESPLVGDVEVIDSLKVVRHLEVIKRKTKPIIILSVVGDKKPLYFSRDFFDDYSFKFENQTFISKNGESVRSLEDVVGLIKTVKKIPPIIGIDGYPV